MTNVERLKTLAVYNNIDNVMVVTDSEFMEWLDIPDLDYEEQGIVLRETLRLTNEDAGYEILRYKAAPREDFYPHIWASAIAHTETRPVYLIVEDLS